MVLFSTVKNRSRKRPIPAGAGQDIIVREKVDRFELFVQCVYHYFLSPNLRYFLSSELGGL